MAEYGGYLDQVDSFPEYTAAEQAMIDTMRFDGIHPYLNELEVQEDTGLQITVATGGATSKGCWYLNDAVLGLTADPESAGSNRKDRVVIEYDIQNRAFEIKLSKGTGTTATPSPPALVDTSTKWEFPLAVLTINGGTLTEIEDEREIKGARYKIQDGEVGSSHLAAGAVVTSKILDTAVTDSKLGTIQTITLDSGDTVTYDSAANVLKLNVSGCTSVQLAPVVFGTSSSAPSGTYPKGTLYVSYEA